MRRFLTRQVVCIQFATALAGCVAEKPFVWIADLPVTPTKGEGLIQVRDMVVVVVRDQVALSGEFAVRDDGGVLVPTVGEVAMGGRSPEDVTAELRTRLAALVVKPQVTVSISRVAPIRVHVVGEVKAPSSYELARDRSVTAALAAAGWMTEFANRDRIFVIRHEGDLRVRFRARELTTPNPVVARFRLCDGDVVVVE
jgi:polysaccharide export outer membrane protein